MIVEEAGDAGRCQSCCEQPEWRVYLPYANVFIELCGRCAEDLRDALPSGDDEE
jgi:hypothetical protein